MMTVEEKLGRNSYKEFLRNMKYDLKQNTFDCGLIPSLKYISLVEIAVRLWKGAIFEKESRLEDAENKIVKNSSSLILPFNCKQDLELMIRSLGKAIEDFCNDEDDFLRPWKEISTKYISNLHCTQQGRINYFKTAVNMVEHSTLSVEAKYIVACNNCFEDKIRALHEMLPQNFLDFYIEDKRDFSTSVLTNYYSLLFFWTYLIRGELEKFSEFTEGVPTYQFILQFAIEGRAYVAVEYIWENFTDEVLRLGIVNDLDYISNPSYAHFHLFLLKKAGNEQTENYLLVKGGRSVLDTLHFITNLFNTKYIIQFLIDLFNTKSILDIISIIKYACKENYITMSELRSIFKTFSAQFKVDVRSQYNSIFESNLGDIFSNEKCEFFILSLIKMGTKGQRRRMLYRRVSMKFCLKNLRSKYFDLFINEMLSSEEEICQFKDKFFDRYIVQLYISTNEEYLGGEDVKPNEVLEELLMKHCSKEAIIELKDVLPYRNCGSITRHFSRRFYEIDGDCNQRRLMKELLNWCFDKNESKISQCKAILYNLESEVYVAPAKLFCKELKEFIMVEDWEMVEQYWKWIFYSTKVRLFSSKEKLARVLKILKMTCRKEGYDQVKKFITTCFESTEVEELREELKCCEEFPSIVKDMLQFHSYLEIDDILQWCYKEDGQGEIKEFKRSFMQSHGCEFLLKLMEDNRNYIPKVELLVKWFNPSVESAKGFKETFVEFVNEHKMKFKTKTTRPEKLRLENKKYLTLLEVRINKCLKILDFDKRITINEINEEDIAVSKKRKNALKESNNLPSLKGTKKIKLQKCKKSK